jgi:hypothetical protein
MYQNLWNIEAP